MFVKIVLIFTIFFLLVDNFDGKPTVEKSQKKIRCFKPDKPLDMPQDVYERYQISSKDLEENEKKDFWSRFVKWWDNIFEQIGKFFKKVGQFFTNLFSKKSKTVTTTAPPTEPPPTPRQKLRKGKKVLICVEYEDDPKNPKGERTTKVYEIDVTTASATASTTASTTDIEKLVTTLSRTTRLMTTTTIERVETTPYTEPEREPDSTPYDPNGDTKEKVPVVIGIEQKAQFNKGEEHTDATIVRAV